LCGAQERRGKMVPGTSAFAKLPGSTFPAGPRKTSASKTFNFTNINPKNRSQARDEPGTIFLTVLQNIYAKNEITLEYYALNIYILSGKVIILFTSEKTTLVPA
jgi:hypothetical protein